jgi:hypothetical protein
MLDRAASRNTRQDKLLRLVTSIEVRLLLGCAFFVFVFLWLIDEVSGYVPLGIGILWVAKRIFVAWAEHQAERKKAEAKGLMQFSIMSSVEKYTPQPLAEGLRCKVVVQGTDPPHLSGSIPHTVGCRVPDSRR